MKSALDLSAKEPKNHVERKNKVREKWFLIEVFKKQKKKKKCRILEINFDEFRFWKTTILTNYRDILIPAHNVHSSSESTVW